MDKDDKEIGEISKKMLGKDYWNFVYCDGCGDEIKGKAYREVESEYQKGVFEDRDFDYWKEEK